MSSELEGRARVVARGLLYRVMMEMTRPEVGMDREKKLNFPEPLSYHF